MPSVAVKVKWLKNNYDVELDLDEPAELFMTQVHFSRGVMCDYPTPRSWALPIRRNPRPSRMDA